MGLIHREDLEIIVWENIGAQVTETVTDTSPSVIDKGSTHDLLRIKVVHNGISADSNIELGTWRFKFYRSDGATPLTDAEMNDTFSDYDISRRWR
ncbi:MAG: hypothetical protein ACE5KV_04830 [Thermoplasmata archaeon]